MDAETAYHEIVERRACLERSRRGRVSDAMRAFRISAIANCVSGQSDWEGHGFSRAD